MAIFYELIIFLQETPMNRKWIIGIGLAVVLCIILFLFLRKPETIAYREAMVEKGNLVATVSASGTVNPVTKVEVGSQVSGLIKAIYVDYNSEVRQGQVIAQIDPEPFELRVRQAQADLDAARVAITSQRIGLETQRIEVERVRLQLEEAKRDVQRKQSLVDKNFISAAEFDSVKTAYQTMKQQYDSAQSGLKLSANQIAQAEASLRQRQAMLEIAQTDLSHTLIRSPVDGVVISRLIDEGQTVAASFQAPKLFEIAENLTEMQVEVNIDEADIGRVKPGQTGIFTVDAYTDRSFTGQIRQIRKAPVVTQNVTTYTALIAVANPDFVLLPGMTANVKILTEQRSNVLMVPNAALRFRPPAKAEKIKQDPEAQADRAGTEKADNKMAIKRYDQFKSLIAQFNLPDENKVKAAKLLEDFKQKTKELSETLNKTEYRQRTAEMVDDLSLQLASLLTADELIKFQSLSAKMIESAGKEKSTFGQVWVLERSGELRSVRVKTGLTDGVMTEITSDELVPGTKIITGLASNSGDKKPKPANNRQMRM